MTNFIMSDQMKLVFVLHNRQGQSLGDKHLKKKLKSWNLFNDPKCFIWSGTRSHILGAKYLTDWIPQWVVSTFLWTKYVSCGRKL